jgi:D-alanyl-D-alanine carboxypeptidase (penicillin-binding protein 5/6)
MGRATGTMGHRKLPHWAALWAVVILILLPQIVRAENETPQEAPAPPDVTAAAACVVELSSGAILWGRDIHAMRAPASVTKMMTALVAVDLAALDTKVTVQESDLVGESSMGLESGETLTLEALLYGMLLPSGNDAAAAIARALGKQPADTDPKESVQHFVDKMNAKAKALGTKETHFANPHGLDEPNHVTSAADLALIGAAFAKNPILLRIAGTVTYDGFGHTVHSTNKLLYDGRFPSVIGGKTGQTDDAGYTLVEIASQNGRLLMSVELGTTADAFWTDAMHLLAYGYATSAPGSPPRVLSRGSAGIPVQTASAPAGPGQDRPAATVAPTGPQRSGDVAATVENTAVRDSMTATTLAIPATHRSRQTMTLRIVLLTLLAAVVCAVIYARRMAVRRTLGEMKQEWCKALADPPHLVATAPMPIIRPHTPEATPTVSSRWAQAGIYLPQGELEVARAYALQAVRQASGGNRLAARQAFKHAVSLNPRLEWGAIPGFWEIPPASYADLATTLIEAGYPAIARSMLTVAALAHPRHPDLRAVEARLARRDPESTPHAAYGGRG